MTTVLAGGDSFIWGSELKDYSNTSPSQSTYPALLAKSSNNEYVCAARPGNANDAITRMTREKCQELINDNREICVIVGWTFSARYEFAFDYNIDSRISPWCSIHPYGNNIDEVDEFADVFFKHVGANWEYQIYRTFEQIVLLQTYLKSNNIPYIFTPADNSVFVQQYNFNNMGPSIKILWDSIDWNNWYFFPPATEEWLTTTPRGFYQWAKENKYECGPNQHPLEKAHKDAAMMLQERFNEMVKKSVQ